MPRISKTLTNQREALLARIRIAQRLAIGNNPAQALNSLEGLYGQIDLRDGEIAAIYLQACAIARIKQRAVHEGLALFERAIASAREASECLYARVLNNYGNAAVQTGRIDLALPLLEEALSLQRKFGTFSEPLVTLAEASLAAGKLQKAATLIKEFHTVQFPRPEVLLAAASVGVPVGLMLHDAELLQLSNDVALLDLAFALGEQWILGPIVDAFCVLYENEGRRSEHDALLKRACRTVVSFDNSLSLAIRIARLADAGELPRMRALMAREAGGDACFFVGHRRLFEALIVRRRRLMTRSCEQASQAAEDFRATGRPLLESMALEAAGRRVEAGQVLQRAGARVPWTHMKWFGAPIGRRLAAPLSPRESQVAQLAAGGSTNKSIAVALHLSERTVHRHCESIFGKLGIRSRWQLSDPIFGLARQPTVNVGNLRMS